MVFGKGNKMQARRRDIKRIEAPSAEDYETEAEVYDEPYEEENKLPPLPPLPQKYGSLSKASAPAEQVEKQTWEVRAIPIQSERVAYNNKTGETLDILSVMVRILNAMEEE